MHNQFAVFSIYEMQLFPSEVMVIFDVENDACSKLFRDVLMDQLMVRGGITAHQVHRIPVFLPVLFIERKPCQMLEFLR